MTEANWLWVVFTIAAALAQTVRNALQSGLARSVGTAGATHVRFLFGLPFGLVFLAAVLIATRAAIPVPGPAFAAWVTVAAVAQILATALMLMAMHERSFVVAVAYIKTEPILVAAFGLIFLGDVLTPLVVAAILLATAGVITLSWVPGMAGRSSWYATALGIAAGAGFALAAVGFRGAILSLEAGSFVLAATFTLAVALAIQALALSAWLWVLDRSALVAVVCEWKPSLAAGLLGAVASQLWFLAFALAAAASVRTLALIEVLFAHVIARRLFAERATSRELAGIGLAVAGVVLLLTAYR